MKLCPQKSTIGIAHCLWRLFSEPGGALFVLISGLLLVLPQLVMPIYAQIYMDEVVGNSMDVETALLWAMAVTVSLAILQYLQLFGSRKLGINAAICYQLRTSNAGTA